MDRGVMWRKEGTVGIASSWGDPPTNRHAVRLRPPTPGCVGS